MVKVIGWSELPEPSHCKELTEQEFVDTRYFVSPKAREIVFGRHFEPRWGVEIGDTITYDKPPKFTTKPVEWVNVRIIDAEYAVLEVG